MLASRLGLGRPAWTPLSSRVLSQGPSATPRAFHTIKPRTAFQGRNAFRGYTFRGHQRRSYANGYRYQRFQQGRNLFAAWRARPTFKYEAGGLAGACGVFYIANLEEVPVSHRRRFNIVSEDFEQQSSNEMYQQVMQQYSGQILPAWHPQHRMVKRVLDRLIPHSGLSADKNHWEVHVIQDEQKNAFVIPGGKVFVFSGILDVCQGDDGLAAVLGHEIAHNVAHHAAERMSGYMVLMPLAIVASVLIGAGDIGDFLTRMAVDIGFMRPGSRKQESEADYIGLMMMSEACYDPRAAVGLWSRMEQAEKGAPPQFLSTHPSSHNRMEKISEWLPKAEVKQEEAGCTNIRGYGE
ncbi:metalloendopeptidase [Zalaria obscura]|uniref:Metalloendopeptidase n=1 Tax=Zalaria obscura TaxID=2024903 RepID=A0ACC3S9X0_9PEZI